MRNLSIAIASIAVVLFSVTFAFAQTEGQADLDKATDLKLSARTLDDLDQVVTLCESALRKGLDDGGRQFAKQLLTSTLYQHATQLTTPIFDAERPNPNWQALRQFAVRDLEKALAHDENMGNAHFLLAKLMVLPGGNAGRASESIDNAVENLQNERDQLVNALVFRAKLKGEPEERLADLTKAIEIDGKNVDALRTRGMLQLTVGKTEAALADLEQVLKIAPEDIYTWEAAAELLASQEKFEEALNYINQVIDKDKESASAYIVRARIYALQQDDAKALDDLNHALKIDGENLAGLLLRARIYQIEEEYDKAKADIDAALKIRPDLTQALLLQAMNAAASGKMNEAIVTLRRVLTIDPQNTQWRLQLAAFYVVDSRPRAAIDVYDELIKEDPKSVMALRGRGDAYLSIGEHKKAVADLSAALAEAPKDSGILNNLAWVLSTSPNDDVRDGAKAIETATKACEETDYKAAHIISTLASAYAESGDFESALKWSQKSIDIADSDEMKQQLKKELEHYQEKKPFRELQETEENKQPLKYGPGEFEL